MREACREHPTHICHEVTVLWHTYVPCRHSAEHRVGPKALLAGFRFKINDFLRHALVHLYVVLLQALALRYR